MKDVGMSPQSGANRQAKFRDEQRKLGRSRCEYWLTPEERSKIEAALHALRDVK